MNKTIVFLGGDNRQHYIKEHLLKCPLINNEYSLVDLISPVTDSKEWILDQILSPSILIAPLPITTDNKTVKIMSSNKNTISIPFENIINKLTSKCIVFAGGFSEDMTAQMSMKNIDYYDYLKCDYVQTKNAIATAEGTIMKAIELSSINLQFSKCLILGFGKCGKVLAKKLKALDAFVTVCARSNSSLCEAETTGYNTLNLNQLIRSVNKYDFIINTIPTLIFNQEVIDNLSKETIIIDIASLPGGINYDYAYSKNIKAFHFLGIPGKISPKSSGCILGDYIIKNLEGLCVK